MGDDERTRNARARDVVEDPPPIEGYSWPEFHAEVLGILRRVASLATRRLDPFAVLERWLGLRAPETLPGRKSSEAWRDSKRARRLIARLRQALDLDDLQHPERPGNSGNVQISETEDTIKMKMRKTSASDEVLVLNEEGRHEPARARRKGKERKGKERSKSRAR